MNIKVLKRNTKTDYYVKKGTVLRKVLEIFLQYLRVKNVVKFLFLQSGLSNPEKSVIPEILGMFMKDFYVEEIFSLVMNHYCVIFTFR